MKKILKLASRRSKYILLISLTITVFTLWQSGMQVYYAKTLVGTTNFFYGMVRSEKHVSYELEKGEPIFKMHFFIDGKNASFPQKIESLLQPTVMILIWNFFLFFVLSTKQALRLFLINQASFLAIQVFFMLQLMGYHTSDFNKFMYEFLKNSFYVIALIFVIKDNLLYPVFSHKAKV